MAVTKKKKEAQKPALRVQGLLFGFAFGFLLQKGGVAQYDLLVGALLLQDFTVFQVMLSAILVGMVGIFTLHRLKLVELHPKPWNPAANVFGGLLFGAGFALSGYCPGTGAAAVGQGNYDAVLAALGLLVGSFLYAEITAAMSRKTGAGDRGKVMLTEIIPAPKPVVIGGAATVILVALVLLARL